MNEDPWNALENKWCNSLLISISVSVLLHMIMDLISQSTFYPYNYYA